MAANQVGKAEISRGRFHNGIKITTTWGKTIQAGGLPKGTSEEIFRFLQQDAEENQEREAAANAQKLSPRITSLDTRVSELLGQDRYTRHSETAWIPEAAKQLLDECDQRTEQHLENHVKSAIAQLRKAANPSELETNGTTATGNTYSAPNSLSRPGPRTSSPTGSPGNKPKLSRPTRTAP